MARAEPLFKNKEYNEILFKRICTIFFELVSVHTDSDHSHDRKLLSADRIYCIISDHRKWTIQPERNAVQPNDIYKFG